MSKNKGGRPTRYTQKLADKICAQLSDGLSMRTVCISDDMPCKTTVFMWLRTKEEFLNQYTRAKQESADALTDEMLDIADDAQNDWTTEKNKDGSEYEKFNSEHVQRSRLRIETRKWLASKLKPKKYGEKIQQEISGTLGITDLTEEELDSKIQQLEQAQEQSTKT